MKKGKKFIICILSFTMLLLSTVEVSAEETENLHIYELCIGEPIQAYSYTGITYELYNANCYSW